MRGLTCFLALALCTATYAADHDALITRLQQIQKTERVPLFGVALYTPEQGLWVNLSDTKLTRETPFRWGSITKSFTALTLYRAAEQKGLALSTPLHEVISPTLWRNPFAATDPIRLIHLAELNSGMTDLSSAEFNDNNVYSLKQALRRGRASRVSHWPPGSQHSYSNAVPGFSQAVIEALTEQSYEQALHRYALQPLGMHSAGVRPRKDLPGGYNPQGRALIPYWNMTFAAFGALNASVPEMASYLHALLHNGVRPDGQRAWSKQVQQQLLTPSSSLAARSGLPVGYAGGIYGRVRDGRLWHTHGGDADGYRSRIALLPAHRTGYVVVINSDNPSALRKMESAIEHALTSKLPRPTPPPQAKAGNPWLSSVTGRYYPSSTRFALTRWQQGQLQAADLVLEDGKLTWRRGRRRSQIIPLNNGLARRPKDPQATLVFAVTAEDHTYLQGELGNFVRTHDAEGRVVACPVWLPTCHNPAP